MRRREVEGLDNRSSLARVMKLRKQGLCRDLGGWRSMSEQQKSLVEVVVRAKALLDAIDTRLLQRVAKGQELSPTAINDRQRFANSYERTLKLLGIGQALAPLGPRGSGAPNRTLRPQRTR